MRILWIPILFLMASCAVSPDEKPIAKVGTEPIKARELKQAFEDEAGDYGSDFLNDPEGNLAVKKQILNSLIRQKLLLQKARETGISLTPDEKNALSRELKSGYDEEALRLMLRQKKISFDDWLRKQEDKKQIDRLLEQEIFSKVPVSRKEIEDYFKKNQRKLIRPDRVHCRHIVASKKEKALTILSLLNQGENFAELAAKYSESPDRKDGGDLGAVAKGEGPVIFQDACFTLNTGQYSQVVASEYGYHIFKVIQKIPGGAMSLKEASPIIEEHLREKKGREVLSSWLEKLYGSAKIQIDEEALKKVVLAGPAPQAPETQPKNNRGE